MSDTGNDHDMSSEDEDVLDRAAKAKRGAKNGRGKGCSDKKAAALQASREKSAAARKVDGEMRRKEAALLKKQKDREREERQAKIEDMEKEEAERTRLLEEHRKVKATSSGDNNGRLDRIEQMLSSLQAPKTPAKRPRAKKKMVSHSETDEDEDEEKHPARKVARASASAEMERRARVAEDKLHKKAKPDNPHKVAGQRLHETSQMHDMLRSMFPSKFA